MPPLDRAVALTERKGRTVIIGQDLHLDVPRVLQVSLQVDVRAAERTLRRAAAGLKGSRELAGPHGDPHADAAPAGGGLDHHRVADPLRFSNGGGIIGECGRSGHDGDAGLDHSPAGLDFVAHGPHAGSRRTDEGQPVLQARLGERRVL